jgi:hypothetical protein
MSAMSVFGEEITSDGNVNTVHKNSAENAASSFGNLAETTEDGYAIPTATSIKYDEYGNVIPTSSGTEYDENGNVLRKTYYYDDFIWFVDEYTYHSNGITRSHHYYDSEGFESTLYYDTNGNPVSEDVGDDDIGEDIDDPSYIPEYNDKGQLIKEICYYNNGDIIETITYEYNQLGQITKRTSVTEEPDTTYTQESIYEYDSLGNLTYEKYINGDFWTVYECVYSEDGVMLAEHICNSDGEKEHYDYTDNLDSDDTSYDVLSEDGKFGYNLYSGSAEITYIAFDKADYYNEKTTVLKEFEDGEVFNYTEYVHNKKELELEIPETVDGYPVVGIYLRDVSYDFITKISLPSTINYISIDEELVPNLKYTEISEDNQYYISQGGVIYPIGCRDIAFLPPAFSGTLVLPATYVGSGGEAYNFDDYGNIKAFEISDNASGVKPKYYTYDGLLYQYEMELYDYTLNEYVTYKNVLISCPAGKTGTVKVNDGTTVIGEEAFQYTKANMIILPDSVEQILFDAFFYAEAGGVVIPESVTYIEDFESEDLDDFMGYQMMYVKSGSYADEYAKALEQVNIDAINTVKDFLEINPDSFDVLFPDDYTKKQYNDILNGYAAKSVDIENIRDGDLDGNGSIGIVDIVTLSKYVLGKATLAPGTLSAADLSGDGVVNSVDLAILRNKVINA